MTQAWNLSQLGNKVDGSGRLDAGTGLANAVPIANGGTGLTSPSLVAGSNISITGAWPNQTINAAGGGVTSLNGQTGAITNTSLYAIGSYIFGRPQNTTAYGPGATVAGSSLYATGMSFWNGSGWFTVTSVATTASLINVGTWQSMGLSISATSGYACLWVRIS